MFKPDGLPCAEGQVVAVYDGGVGGRCRALLGSRSQGFPVQKAGNPSKGAGQTAEVNLSPSKGPNRFGVIGRHVNDLTFFFWVVLYQKYLICYQCDKKEIVPSFHTR